jgi:hypothetical protein
MIQGQASFWVNCAPRLESTAFECGKLCRLHGEREELVSSQALIAPHFLRYTLPPEGHLLLVLHVCTLLGVGLL